MSRAMRPASFASMACRSACARSRTSKCRARCMPRPQPPRRASGSRTRRRMIDPHPAEGKSHKLWGGRFDGGPAPELEAVNRSIDVDFRLWPHDVQLSKAWAVALWNAGVLTLEESKELERGLDDVAQRIVDLSLIHISEPTR